MKQVINKLGGFIKSKFSAMKDNVKAACAWQQVWSREDDNVQWLLP